MNLWATHANSVDSQNQCIVSASLGLNMNMLVVAPYVKSAANLSIVTERGLELTLV
jgi:hypothetical protein